ncbi:MAG: tRNA (guanosine(46)-N7)-methyltransferase TrmB [Pseudaminobacter sp.]|nr:tRNA (guanosine(46)-N7)-methyltransferase TrmB [Pseudaminobacter sp.]
MTAERRVRSTEGFYGRRHGRTIRPEQATVLADGLERYGIDLAKPAPNDLRSLFPTPVVRLRLEIGFGGGEHLRHAAETGPSTGFIGVEPFINGMAKMMVALRQHPLDNLRVYDDDATRVLDWLPASSLDGVDLFYPDPWPKKRHWKRRFVSPVNLDRFARVLKSGGAFRFASDIEDYVNWTLQHCRAHAAFEWRAQDAADWHKPYETWVRTRYEAKAFREGRRPAYLTFARVVAAAGDAG